MNENTRNTYVYFGLEILKRSVLLVLYQEHLECSHPRGLPQEVIRERLDIPKGRSGANKLIRGILEILEIQETVEYLGPGSWKITAEGIRLIEQGERFDST